MTYDITFIDEKRDRKVTYDNVKMLNFYERGVIVTCDDGFKGVWEAHEFTHIKIDKRLSEM